MYQFDFVGPLNQSLLYKPSMHSARSKATRPAWRLPVHSTVLFTQLLVQEGEIAKVGAGLCLIEVEEEADSEGHRQGRSTSAASSGTVFGGRVKTRRPL